MKYKAGDEVLINAKICSEILEDVYEIRTKNTGSIAVSDEEIVDKTYEMGSKDAWELAKRIERMQFVEREKVFGLHGFWEILQKYTPQEALAKIETYEQMKEIKVGDEVIHDADNKKTIFFVTRITKGIIKGYDTNGDTYSFVFPNRYIEKTGRHVEIEGLLGQIEKPERDDDHER